MAWTSRTFPLFIWVRTNDLQIPSIIMLLPVPLFPKNILKLRIHDILKLEPQSLIVIATKKSDQHRYPPPCSKNNFLTLITLGPQAFNGRQIPLLNSFTVLQGLARHLGGIQRHTAAIFSKLAVPSEGFEVGIATTVVRPPKQRPIPMRKWNSDSTSSALRSSGVMGCEISE